MLASLKRLSLGLLLIGAAATLLLVTDLGSREKKGASGPAGPARRTMRVALLQPASQAVLDEGRDGIVAGLAERGWVNGRNLEIRFYNSQGDMGVAQAIAKEMAGGGYDLLLTVSTGSLQAVANANRAGKTPHVFALVTDPYGAGVGISRTNLLDHPPHMAGYGSMQPIGRAFQIAYEMNPGLKKVGVVWNAAESNSEAQIKLARKVCAGMGIELYESTVDGSAGVGEAASALVARGVDAIWIPGDVTVMTAADSVVAAARKGRIPVFTVIPPTVKRGALFDLGADYPEVGRLAGLLAGDILNGREPSTVPVQNILPEVLTLNRRALMGLKDRWIIPSALAQKAHLVIDENGVAQASAAAANPNPTGRRWKIAEVLYSETASSEQTLAGMKDAWARSALVEGRDYEVKLRSAQGDMPLLGGILDAALGDGADIVVTLSTPTLQAALRKVRGVPIVFTLCTDPIAAGAGKSYADHLPNVTGITVFAPTEETLDLLQKFFPSYRSFGTIYCPAELNSVVLMKALESSCRKRGLGFEAVAANSSADLPDAALALVSRPIDAVLQVSDTLSSGGFSAITRAARQAKKPLFSLNNTTVAFGAAFAMGRDFHNSGEATVGVIERLIRGESPSSIPFSLAPKVISVASPSNARAVGITLPQELLDGATKVLP